VPTLLTSRPGSSGVPLNSPRAYGGLRLGRVACLLDAGKPGDALEGLDDAARKPLSYVEAFTYDSRNNLKTYVDAQLPSFSP